ncbi:MAG: c-type cytochrome [Paracoccaceae bacterium]|tara:strand:- start:290 stop:724 length:435 start_codon:yes stop_codon:yes gene_type:complete
MNLTIFLNKKTILLILVMLLGTSAQADIIQERKNAFRDNSIALRAITKSIRSKDFENIIKNARVIEKWSIIMSEYFPKGSGQGNTNASENIWLDFNSFKLKISENTTATRALIAAAEAKSISDIKQLTNNLGSTCQSCHMKFKR